MKFGEVLDDLSALNSYLEAQIRDRGLIAKRRPQFDGR
jgi:hypothetical protein